MAKNCAEISSRSAICSSAHLGTLSYPDSAELAGQLFQGARTIRGRTYCPGAANSQCLGTPSFYSKEKRRCRTISDTGKECGWQTRDRETSSRTARLRRASGRTRHHDNTPCANNNHSEKGLFRCDAGPGAIIRLTSPETTDIGSTHAAY